MRGEESQEPGARSQEKIAIYTKATRAFNAKDAKFRKVKPETREKTSL